MELGPLLLRGLVIGIEGRTVLDAQLLDHGRIVFLQLCRNAFQQRLHPADRWLLVRMLFHLNVHWIDLTEDSQADDFEREVETLRQSRAFQEFLAMRSSCPQRIPLEDIERELQKSA
jgi:hypothetical protein